MKYLKHACVAMVIGLSGCATFWDDMTANDVHWSKRLSYALKKQDPMVVLSESTDGARRARAFAQLNEPLANGGTQEDQDFYVELLQKAATQEREPTCRLGAIRSLAKFKDPRAVKILEEVYLQRLPFTPDLNSIIRQNALAALEETRNPEARHLLIRVARQPSGGPDSSYLDRQQTNDERLTALRALARYPQYDAVDALVYVLENERDVALRDRAHESLKQVTGKRLPDDAVAWRNLIDNGPTVAREPGIMRSVASMVGLGN